MTNQSLLTPTSGAESTPQVVQRVYCEPDAHMYAEDGTPLYFEWIIEGKDGALFIVPAQPAGWLRRKPSNERTDRLISVPPHIAAAVVRLTHADVDNPGHLSAVSTGDYTNYTEQPEYMYHS